MAAGAPRRPRGGWVPDRPARVAATLDALEPDGADDFPAEPDPAAGAEAEPGAERSHGWSSLVPASVRGGTVELGRAHVGVIILLVLIGAGLGAWSLLRSDPDVVPVRAQPVSSEPAADGTVGPPVDGDPADGEPTGGDPADGDPAGTGREAADREGAGAPNGAASTAPAPDPSAPLLVHVAGRVERPGVVTLPPGARVVDAIESAGGLQDGAELGGLNLAQVLTDGQQVLVGIEPPEGAGAVIGGTQPDPAGDPGSGDPTSSGLVDLNTAGLAELDELPGIGPALAQRILDWRETNGSFTDVTELLEVSGIGESRLEDLRDLVTW